MNKDLAQAVEMPYWQAPNDDVLVKLKGSSLKIIFEIWLAPARYSKMKGVIDFTCVWSTRLERNKELSYYNPSSDEDFTSCYWIVPESSWLKKLESDRSLHSPDWKKYDTGTYKHYIIQSNDFYIEVIAKAIRISKKHLHNL
jgi:hypothetical protein